jgi:adenylate kinase
MPPKVDMICDCCGAKLFQRPDDKEETIKMRLEVYQKETSGLVRYYDSRKKLHRLLADEEAEVVLDKIVQITQKYHDPLKV